MERDANTAFGRALVDEWARAGVRHAALAPGSRSTPLALALAADDRIELEVFLDERSASFFALGAGKASGRPAVVLSTSGTAAVNLHPAVVEGHHAQVPMLVCTADRPPELRDTGAGQTIDQTRLFGTAVRWFADPGPPEDREGAGTHWRSVAARAIGAATGPQPGPVHLNLPFREPLVPAGAPLVDAPGRPDGRPWTVEQHRSPGSTDGDVEAAVEFVSRAGVARQGVIVAGAGTTASPSVVEQLASTLDWPVLADPLSGLRTGDDSIASYDLLLRDERFVGSHRPEVVLQLGAAPTGRAVLTWLEAAARRAVVANQGVWPDPARSAELVVRAAPDPLLRRVAEHGIRVADESWRAGWVDAEHRARSAVDALVDTWDEPFEGRVARDVVATVPSDGSLVVASSMPVRDVEAFARPRSGLRFLANRGANGIDGFVSTVLGVAAADPEGAPTVALLGDLCLLHDANGLVGANDRNLDATFVVLDNDGGGIFSFLAQASAPEASRHFETLFGTPHGVDLVELAALHGLGASRVTRADDVVPALRGALADGGVRLVVVPSDRSQNVDRHRAVVDAVAAALH